MPKHQIFPCLLCSASSLTNMDAIMYAAAAICLASSNTCGWYTSTKTNLCVGVKEK